MTFGVSEARRLWALPRRAALIELSVRHTGIEGKMSPATLPENSKRLPILQLNY
jgi:hypothetical protein